MSNTSENFIKLNRTNLVNAIYRVFPIEKTRLRKGVKENIWPRLDFMHGRRNSGDRYFIFEEDYIETEWKDMISIHYINTSYHVQNTVMRIHIFSNNEISETSYIGFFTLRKIDEPRFMLSYIYPNWTNIYCNSKRFHVMKYQKAIHIAGHELTLYTYPLFVQDNITVACAQASMVSMTQYLHNKFDYSKVRIKELGNAFITGKTKLFPSAGLLPTQMIEIFNYYDISVGFKVFKCEEENHNEYDMEYEKYRQYIDYSVESGMPVILGITIEDNGIIKRHILQIIGHTIQDRESYVVYDDSGYFLKNGLNMKGFVAAVDWKQFKPYIKNNNSFIIYPIHEKVYLLFDEFKKVFKEMYLQMSNLRNLEENNLSYLDKTRYFLADNRDVKAFVKNNIDNSDNSEVEKEIEKILNSNLTHYVWCAEVPFQNGYFIFLADPTYGRLTTNNIFYNKIPLSSKKQFGLL